MPATQAAFLSATQCGGETAWSQNKSACVQSVWTHCGLKRCSISLLLNSTPSFHCRFIVFTLEYWNTLPQYVIVCCSVNPNVTGTESPLSLWFIPPARVLICLLLADTSAYCLGNRTLFWHCSLFTMAKADLHSDSNWLDCQKTPGILSFCVTSLPKKTKWTLLNIDSDPNVVATGNWPANTLHSGQIQVLCFRRKQSGNHYYTYC